MALNAKQYLFVQEYLIDLNGGRAALVAGYGKTLLTAQKTASDLLKKPEVKESVEKGLRFKAEEAHMRSLEGELTKEKWLAEVRLLAFANMDDFVEITKNRIKGEKQGKKGEKTKDYDVINVSPIPSKDRPRHLGRVIKKISETKNGIGIELHSKQAALELLARHFGWVKNEVDMNLPDNAVTVKLIMPSNGFEAPSGGDDSEGN